MNTEALLRELAEHNVKLSVKEGKLVCQLPEGGINSDLMNRLKLAKQEIMQFIADARKSRLTRTPITKQPAEVGPKPLSHAQQRLWVLDQIEGSTHYNILNGLLLKGALDVELFQKVFDTILQRHEVLRTTYHLDEQGNVRQEVQPFRPLNIRKQDLRSYDKTEQDALVEKARQEEFNYPFSLRHDVMIRLTLLRVKDDEHVVLLNMHHIATDGWSIGILIKEFNALYTAFYNGTGNPLPEPVIQYSDYAYWQQEWLKGDMLEELKKYWLNQLTGLPPVHNLPLDFARPNTQTFSGNTVHTQIGKEALDSLKKICDQEGTTLFTGLYTVFTVLLSRYSNEQDIVLGTPVANREQTEVQQLIGLFMNMLLLRGTVEPGDHFSGLLARNKKMLSEAFSHQQMPFDMLVTELRPGRDMSYNSLFQVMFVLQNNEKGNLELPGLSLMQLEQAKPFAMYDLTLTVNEYDGGLLLSWEYNTGLFRETTIKKMAAHFERLFTSLVAFPQQKVCSANMIGDAEQNRLLFEFNQTAKPYATGKTVIDLLEEQVQATPAQTAVKFGGIKYNYRQLDQLTSQFAHYLQAQYGIVPDDLVAIQLDRSEKLPIAIIGILKAAAAYVPLGTDYPEERVSYILRDTGTKVLVNEAEMEKFFSVAGQYPGTAAPAKPAPGNLAYCIYTSGSTGVPKGVLNRHDGLFNRLVWMKEYLELKGSEIYLQKTAYTFDVSVWEFLLPVISGGTLVMAKPDGHKDPEYLEETIRNEQVNIVHFVPSMLSIFLQFAGQSALPHLRHIVCSGEELLPGMVKQSRRQWPQVRIHNFYGPTEAAIDVTALDVTDIDVSGGVTIGKPVANTRIYIVDEALNLQPVGIPGELLISGIQVAKGYLNLDELTKERFIGDPFFPGERVYRTGDIAVWLENGTIRYMGRRDNQVKIRGNRIELGSITSKLLQVPGIRDAVVTVHKHKDQPHELAAYVVADAIQNATDLRKALAAKLPDYEIPSIFIQLDQLPLSPNGKIDTKALPGPEHNKLPTGIAYTAPENKKEETLVELFAKELDRPANEIGVNDNFFDLGANSIKLIKILHEVNRQFGLDLKPVLLFQYTTVKLLSGYIFGGTADEKEEEDDNTLSDEINSLMDLMEE